MNLELERKVDQMKVMLLIIGSMLMMNCGFIENKTESTIVNITNDIIVKRIDGKEIRYIKGKVWLLDTFVVLNYSTFDLIRGFEIDSSSKELDEYKYFYLLDGKKTVLLKDSIPNGCGFYLDSLDNYHRFKKGEKLPPNVCGLIAYFVDRDSNSHKMLITSYYSTGEKKERAHLKNDKYNGLFERWYSTGEKWRETSYLNDKILSRKHWDKNGKLYIEVKGKARM